MLKFVKNDLTMFVEKMVQKKLTDLLRSEFAPRKMFIDCGRREGHSMAAYAICMKYAFLFPDIIIIGMNNESLNKFAYQGFKTLTAAAVKTNALRGWRTSLVVVDDYKEVIGNVPKLHEEIDITCPIFTLYLQ